MKHLCLGLIFALFTLGGPALATEEPAFRVVLGDGAFEVRDYPALLAAEVTVGGSRDEASNAGFRLLAGYIFGGNTRRQSIAMTAPVIQERAPGETIAMTAPVIQTGGDSEWIVRFVMPGAYTRETLPTPNDRRVRIVPVPPRRFAVLRPPAPLRRRGSSVGPGGRRPSWAAASGAGPRRVTGTARAPRGGQCPPRCTRGSAGR